MDFRLNFKSSIDSIKIEVRFIDDLPSIFEDHFSIAMINIFDILEDFYTNINEVILINKESNSIPEKFMRVRL